MTNFERNTAWKNNILREFCSWLHWDQNFTTGFKPVVKNFTKKIYLFIYLSIYLFLWIKKKKYHAQEMTILNL